MLPPDALTRGLVGYDFKINCTHSKLPQQDAIQSITFSIMNGRKNNTAHMLDGVKSRKIPSFLTLQLSV